MGRKRLMRKGSLPGRADIPFKSIVQATIGFVGIIMILVMASSVSLPTTSIAIPPQLYMSVDDIPESSLLKLDAVLVLGGGVPPSLEYPLPFVQKRCDDAAAVVHRHRSLTNSLRTAKNTHSSLPVLCLSAGTVHGRQLLSADGLPVWESTSCAAYLQVHHAITEHVYVETTSYDTISNAFFARVSHTDITGWKKLLIITSEFHMDRTRAIFDWIFGVNDHGYQLSYLVSADTGLDDQVLDAREKKERESLESLKQLRTKYTSLQAIWTFLNEEHDLYTAAKLVELARQPESAMEGQKAEWRKSYGA